MNIYLAIIYQAYITCLIIWSLFLMNFNYIIVKIKMFPISMLSNVRDPFFHEPPLSKYLIKEPGGFSLRSYYPFSLQSQAGQYHQVFIHECPLVLLLSSWCSTRQELHLAHPFGKGWDWVLPFLRNGMMGDKIQSSLN